MTDKLKSLYAEIEALNDEIPAQLAKKIKLNAELLKWYGKYHAEAIRDHGYRYAERKRIYGEAIINTSGTAKDKEAMAEKECYQARMAEADAEMEVWKWRNLCSSTSELIQALKIEQKTLMSEYNGGAG